MIARRPDWRSRLSAAIEARRRAPQKDCGLFVADCLMAMTGVDLAARYRGAYTTVLEGLELLRADGFADLCTFATFHLEEIPPALARAGDVVAFRSEATGWALGIVVGERATVLHPGGIGTVERSGAHRAFRVP